MDYDLSLSDDSPLKLTSIQTPLLNFRPRKFSSPFVVVPPLKFDDITDLRLHDEGRSLLADSGLGSTFADYDADKSRLCPKYHNEGLCELGPNCPLVHEEKSHDVKMTSFDPMAPEFVPRFRQGNATSASQSWHAADVKEDSIARVLTDLALRNRVTQMREAEETSCSSRSPESKETGVFENDSCISDVTPEEPNYKTELCTSYVVTGNCKFMSNCKFAHGVGELRRRINPLKFKTEPCTTYHTIGSCPYGDKCNFYHNIDEKNTSRLKTRLCKTWNATGKCEYGARCDFAHGSDELSVKFKTRMCKVFLTTGRCPYGAQCTFAHNESEKRKDISTVYKFKTEMCQLWLKGKCTFGPICHFAHGAHELESVADLPQ